MVKGLVRTHSKVTPPRKGPEGYPNLATKSEMGRERCLKKVMSEHKKISVVSF